MSRLFSVFAGGGAVLILTLLALVALKVSPEHMQLDIPQGTSVRAVSKQIANKSAFVPWWVLELAARATGNPKRIKAGVFTLKESHSTLGVWSALNQAQPEMVQVKWLEGWTFKQMRAATDAAKPLKHDTAGMSDAQLMQLIGAPALHPEGRFFPDTYALAQGSSDVLLYKTAFEKMQKTSERIWLKRPANSPLNSVDALLNLAAIVEKETGLSSDRAAVASVFHNRLRIGMRLQTDPTVIYGMGDAYTGRIRKVDLEADTPYNTYTRSGLPPTPIAAPSEASLLAALLPAETPYFYFVAKGDGTLGSYFSATLPEHNRAVVQYLANRAQTRTQ